MYIILGRLCIKPGRMLTSEPSNLCPVSGSFARFLGHSAPQSSVFSSAHPQSEVSVADLPVLEKKRGKHIEFGLRYLNTEDLTGSSLPQNLRMPSPQWTFLQKVGPNFCLKSLPGIPGSGIVST